MHISIMLADFLFSILFYNSLFKQKMFVLYKQFIESYYSILCLLYQYT